LIYARKPSIFVKIQDAAWTLRGAGEQPAKPDDTGKKQGECADIAARFLEDMLTVWNETNEDGKQTGINALRLVAATNPAAFVAAMGKLVTLAESAFPCHAGDEDER
jgi:hypothetical protein